MKDSEDVIFFQDPDAFRKWLEKNHLVKTEQWVGFYKKNSGLKSITWPESVDQALCFGWIDGIRKSIDEISYKIRFTPRKPRSHWSAVNIKKMSMLKKKGLLKPAGIKAFSFKDDRKSERASYEQTGEVKLADKYLKVLKRDQQAWEDYCARPPSYRKQCIWWIMSAKREDTRSRRLELLIESCKKGVKIPPLRWQK